MPTFSTSSVTKLQTCDKRLQDICHEAIALFDFSVVCGHRGREEQNKAYQEGKSKLNWPDSKHNKNPSLAVDLVPYRAGIGADWDDVRGFYYLAGIIMGIAYKKGIKLRWGGDFNRNGVFTDERFIDLPHFELE